MPFYRKSIAIFLVSSGTALLLLSTAHAAENTDKKTSSWSGSAELGASVSTGNSRTSNVNGKLQLKYESGPWSHRFKLSSLQASEDGNSTANRTVGELSTHYDLNPSNYAFDTLRASHDAFSGYSYQATIAAGLGHKLWVSDRGGLSVEAGPGYRRSKLKDGPAENNLIGLAKGDFSYKISETAKFEQTLLVLGGAANTELESVSGLSVNLTKTMALKVAYTVQHNTNVPADKKKTDTFTSVNLVYAFGDN